MDALISFEVRNLLRSKVVYICFILGLLSFIMTHGALKSMGVEGSMGGGAYSYSLNAIDQGMFLVLAAIAVAVRVCYDYEYNIIKNIYAKGYWKKEVYVAKLLVTLATGTVAFLVLALAGFLYGFVTLGMGSGSPGDYLMHLIVLYLICMAQLSLYVLVAVFFKKAGITIAVLLIGPVIVSVVTSFIDYFVIGSSSAVSLSSFWIGSAYDDVISLGSSSKDLLKGIILAIVYMIITTLAGLFVSDRDC